jgi:thiamine-phosphate pyrophosphorylase
VNDNLKIAKEAEADGVHLGKEDMDAMEARKIAGDNFIIGGTANTMEDIRVLNAKGVNYIGLGPFRFTSTKANLSPVLGLDGYKKIMQQCAVENISLPFIAIGGIQLNDVASLMNTGVYGIAISSAISNASDISAAAKRFLKSINQSV